MNHLDAFDAGFFQQTPIPAAPWLATHEAGHACMYMVLGIAPGPAWINLRTVEGYAAAARSIPARLSPLVTAGGAGGEQVLLGYNYGTLQPPHLCTAGGYALPGKYAVNRQALYDGSEQLDDTGTDLAKLISAARNEGADAKGYTSGLIKAAEVLLAPHAYQLESIARHLAHRGRLSGEEVIYLWNHPATKQTAL